MEQILKLNQCDESPQIEAYQYPRLVGMLLYLQAIRPDIAYVINMLSQVVSDPRVVHIDDVVTMLCYLNTTPSQGIFILKEGRLSLVAYCEAD